MDGHGFIDMAIEISNRLALFVSDMVVKTKQQIILKQGGYLGHPQFVPAKSKQDKGYTLIDTGKMLSSITCQVERVPTGIHIIATSNAEYSSFVQLKDGKNWDIMTFTDEEMLYYAEQIQNNTSVKVDI